MKHLSRDEMRTMLAVARAHSERDWLMILVAYLHGLRASEVCGRSGVERKVKGKLKVVFPIRGVDICDGELTTQRLKGLEANNSTLGLER